MSSIHKIFPVNSVPPVYTVKPKEEGETAKEQANQKKLLKKSSDDSQELDSEKQNESNESGESLETDSENKVSESTEHNLKPHIDELV